MTPTSNPAAEGAQPVDLGGRITDALLEGAPLGSLLGIRADDFEQLYALGHGFYQQARYEEASRIFGFLALHDHMEPRFILALGASLQMTGRYEEAVRVYTVAVVLDPADPVPTFHLAECLIALERIQDAVEGLEMVIAQCDPGQHDALLERADGLRGLLAGQAAGAEEARHEH